jgi:hypothetical protein
MRTTIRDAGDLKAVNKQLRQQADGKELRKELTGGIRQVLGPVRDQVKAAYLAGPSRELPKSRSRAPLGSLRRLLAKATRIEVRTTGRMAGARIRVDGRKMPAQMRSLPAMWEGPPRGKRWRHPVFGDRETWVAQPSHPTFYPTVEPHTDDAGRAVDKVLDGIRRELERRR